MRRQAVSFETHVAARRFESVAYDRGYRAYALGHRMVCECSGAAVFRTDWYEGYLDAKYPETKYDLERKDAKNRL